MLDPIDGTVNFVYGIEAYAVSVGVQVDGSSVAGAVANVPAGRGVLRGAQSAGRSCPTRRCAGRRCASSSVDELSMALVGTGFGYAREQRLRQADVLAGCCRSSGTCVGSGSCALDLCMVAAGRLDAYYEDGVHVWDWAAGALIAAEAGAVHAVAARRGGGRPDRRRRARHRRGVRRRVARAGAL